MLVLFPACKPSSTLVERGIKTQTLHVGNGLEPHDLDPHLVTATNEIKILSALFEGLIGQNPIDLSPVSAAAESWTISENRLKYTFLLRDNLYWDNGDKLTSDDFKFGIQRILTPELAAPNAYLLFVLKNAEAFNKGAVKFDEVGVTNPNESTLILELKNPASYLLNLLSHPAWFPVHRKSLATHGNPFKRSTSWTQPDSMVSNGPFSLVEWRVNEYVRLNKNNLYWDNQTTKLYEIFFYPTENLDAEERAEFLADMGLEEPGLSRVIRAGYELLGLQTFLTSGPKESRAWTVWRGATAQQAAGTIHTDFARGFIRAEIASFDDFVYYRGENGAKEAGRQRSEGKEYIMRDGDVVNFRFNV